MSTQENPLTYTPNPETNSDSDSDPNSNSYLSSDDNDGFVQFNTESREQTVATEEYDSSSEADTMESIPDLGTNIDEYSTEYVPKENDNFFEIGDKVCVCLLPNQSLYVSGIFNVQAVKGEIIYNGCRYTSSMIEKLTFWHPLCNSVPPIQSCETAALREPIEDLSECKINVDKYACILYILPGPVDGLMDAWKLYPDVRYFWKPKRDDETDSSFAMETFTILQGVDVQFSAFRIPSSWESSIDKLSIISKNATHDTRIMVIGGKNTGKSSFLRLLTERLLYTSNVGGGDNCNNNEDIFYFDLDPGQPEYSLPESLSLVKITNENRSMVLGNCLGQHNFLVPKQYYFGSANPEDNLKLYLGQVDDLIEFFETELFYGVSVLNLPGWAKGLGMHLINHVIQKYKPTCIVIIDSPSTNISFSQELNIPRQFSSALQKDYSSVVIRFPTFSSPSATKNTQPKYQSSQIRILKKLLLFHRLPESNDKPGRYQYNFNPLVSNSPLQIGLGVRGGIEAIKYDEEFKVLHKDDIKCSLEGTVVAITLLEKTHYKTAFCDPIRDGLYPLIYGNIKNKDVTFLTLGIIHSIDEDKRLMNIYVPPLHAKTLHKYHTWSHKMDDSSVEDAPEELWCIIRSKSEVPFCEICPQNGISYGWNIVQMPYVSVLKRKKHEHVWKIRKNILRRGYVNK